jgi:Bacterial Ig-like domain
MAIIFCYTTSITNTILGAPENASNNTANKEGNTTNAIIKTLNALSNQTTINTTNAIIKTLNNITNQNKNNTLNNSTNNAINKTFNEILPNSVSTLLLSITFLIFVPVMVDLFFAYLRKPKQSEGNHISGMPGLYRALMTFGIVIIVGVIAIFLVTLIALNIAVSNPTVQSLIDILKNLSTILGTSLASVIAFYFGSRSSESATQKALAFGSQSIKILEVVEVDPIDGSMISKLDSPISATFNEQIRSASITPDSFMVKKDKDNNPHKGNITLTNNKLTIKYESIDPFDKDTIYHIIISTGITDIIGNKLASSKQWSFNTEK